jgi:hypothetical protein
MENGVIPFRGPNCFEPIVPCPKTAFEIERMKKEKGDCKAFVHALNLLTNKDLYLNNGSWAGNVLWG